jgi:hypothetical protein
LSIETLAKAPNYSGGDFLPPTAGAYDLGSTSLEWDDLYLGNDSGIYMGAGQDNGLYHKSAAYSANAEISGVTEGTEATLAAAAKSLFIFNVLDDGDVTVVVNKGGNSHTAFLADGSTGDTILNASAGQSVDLYVAGTKEYDFSATDADFNANTLSNVGASGNDWASTSLSFAAASTVKTSAGILTIDGDDGLLLKTTGSAGSYITRGTYHISQVITKISIADNSATAVFTITTTNETTSGGNADGGGYACHVRALVGHTLHATGSDFQAARSFSAHFARAVSTGGANSASTAVVEIAESASAVTYPSNAARRDINAITMTIVDTSAYVQTVSFTVDITNPGGGGSVGTAEVVAMVDLIYYGFNTPPVIAVA